ncbi:MAG: hypothetical protein COA67_01655 [Lutibacter sp.]|nr:MAG: hypothetical protein COA67_01655 [Lutibacter sp.]
MNDKDNHLLDDFINKMIKETPIEKPSADFSGNVMDAINTLELKKAKRAFEPLISKKVWLLISAGIITLTIFLLNTGVNMNEGYLSNIDLSKFTNAISFETSYNLNVSNTAMYGFIFLAIMIPIQIGYLKNRHDRKFN